MKSVLTLLSALACKGWWQICGRPCRPAAAPPWRRRQRWAAAGLSGELETGTSDWHVPTCEKTPIRSSHNGPRKKKKKRIHRMPGRCVLDLQCDSLRDADADSGWQDTVATDLSLCSVFQHCSEPACPGEGKTQTSIRDQEAATDDSNLGRTCKDSKTRVVSFPSILYSGRGEPLIKCKLTLQKNLYIYRN